MNPYFIIVCLLFLVGCGGGRRYETLMQQADSLLSAGEAMTAYRMLEEADSQKTAWSRRQQMAYELLKAQVQNQAYVDFQTDSVMREVVRYYDRHGTANERLKAHYLLGCVYRDLHEAPIALLTWEDAVACADTAAADCDYATLFRVYGQMADVYYRQYMPEKQLEAQQNLCKYALLSLDTLNYINGLLRRNDAYLALGDTTAIYQNIEHVRCLYIQRGMIAEATQVYPTAIQIALENQQFAEAGRMLHEFETKSGLFDEEGHIVPTREIHYYYKGMYYLGINQLDSSEYWFRKTMKYENFRVDAYRGLLAVYRQRHILDSIYKYDILHESALGHFLKQTKTIAIAQAEGMYDYHRHERIAQELQQIAHQRYIILTLVISFSCFIGILTYLYMRKKRMEKERAMNKLMEDYDRALKHLDKARKEKVKLTESLVNKDSAMALLQEKAEQVGLLESLVHDLQMQICKSPETIVDKQIVETDIMKHFHQIAHPHFEVIGELRRKIDARAATTAEWDELIEAIRLCHPSFYLFIKEQKLSSLKSKLCILSRLGFDNQEIATLADAKIGSVNNARTSLAKDKFKLKSTLELDLYLRNI